MTDGRSCIYKGVVVHKRMTPRPHAFRYNVFSLCLDVDDIDRLDRDIPIFSRNRRNLVSLHDTDFGAGKQDPVAAQARRLLAEAGQARFSSQILLLCYPRILGYVFNPLSVFFCYDGAGILGTMIYEVSNTFGERKSYVIPVDHPADFGATAQPGSIDPIAQVCAKDMYVSPFIAAAATYGFRIVPPNDEVVVGVSVRGAAGPILRTHFRGRRGALSTLSLVLAMLQYPAMTLKVIVGIHRQAASLWLKGVPLVSRYVSPRYSVTVVPPPLSSPLREIADVP